MINKTMKNNRSNLPKENDKSQGKKPNEYGGIYVSTHLKIFDPNTQQVLVQKRGDN